MAILTPNFGWTRGHLAAYPVSTNGHRL